MKAFVLNYQKGIRGREERSGKEGVRKKRLKGLQKERGWRKRMSKKEGVKGERKKGMLLTR